MFNFTIALEEHKRLFPKATIKSQLLKLNEEYDEYKNAKTLEEAYQEFGDFLFVVVSLRRFKHTKIIAESLLNEYYFSYPVGEQKRIMSYVADAYNKVKKRVDKGDYYYKDGLYDRKRPSR